MKASELRIGNLVLMETPDGSFQKWKEAVHSVVHYDLDDDETGFSGIPLTEEWLFKFGFDKARQQNDILYSKTGTNVSLTLLLRHRQCYASVINDYVRHVHQLQNLYFALTGDELTISK